MLWIWDIMGKRGFHELLKEAYFYGADGILAVGDGTRPDGLDGIDEWVSSVLAVTRRVPVVILVNTEGKTVRGVFKKAVAAKAKAYNAPYFYTSTRTRANVERAFQTLAEAITASRPQQSYHDRTN